MSFSPSELTAIKQFCEDHSPPELKDKLWFEYTIKDHSVEFFEVRPHWKDPTLEIRIPLAKVTYILSRKKWKLYWMRQNQRWSPYSPHPEGKTLGEILGVINQDRHGCFFG